MTIITKILDKLFKRRIISDCQTKLPYLYRWYIFRTKPIAIFLHRFVRSDFERALHDHPWDFIVIPIWRGYIEHNQRKCNHCQGEGYSSVSAYFNTNQQRCPECGGKGVVAGKKRVYPIIGARCRPATYAHRVELIKNAGELLPSWSIFIRFRERRTWGFHMPTGWINWKAFDKERCV